jgi:hypothetical protein
VAQQIIWGKVVARWQLAELWQLFVQRDVNAVASKLRAAIPIYLDYMRMPMKGVIELLTLRHAVLFTKMSARSPWSPLATLLFEVACSEERALRQQPVATLKSLSLTTSSTAVFVTGLLLKLRGVLAFISQVSSWEICVGQSGTGTGFSPHVSVFLSFSFHQ